MLYKLRVEIVWKPFSPWWLDKWKKKLSKGFQKARYISWPGPWRDPAGSLSLNICNSFEMKELLFFWATWRHHSGINTVHIWASLGEPRWLPQLQAFRALYNMIIALLAFIITCFPNCNFRVYWAKLYIKTNLVHSSFNKNWTSENNKGLRGFL